MDENPNESVENEEIKSTAVVKYSLPKQAHFMKLQCNTDLNLPPSNWLSSSADSYGLQHVLTHPKGFSSFKMAQMFPDCVGGVDVVSDAENIKKLLKVPYHKTGHISMMVHRIENTLLLDDFDIYKHLLRTAETEWEWLRKFFFDNISRATYNEDKNLYTNSRRRAALQEKNLVSKFLYHSLVPTENAEGSNLVETNKGRQPVKDPVLPEPSPSTECPDSPTSGHKYNRNVVWTFEDIEMFLGTDMPIFGGGTHPCISLRLRDMSKPISVLTGIDYWLDNLMSNVPEVVMCYHLNGIVQKYELIKTEDLPRLDNSKFSPKLIRDVAQSILSFLKSNATKAGHTYWLFKAKDEEVIKLYDLTSLCSEKDVENGQNPFTIPVAMLLYRVARNMKHSSDRLQPGTIRMLLKNCIKLLPQEKYPEIVASSLYMLSDLYVPANTNPENPGLGEQEADEENESLYEDDLSDDDDCQEEHMKILVLENNRFEKFKNYYKPPAPIVGGVEERCQQALQHVTAGLNCLKYLTENTPEKRSENKEDEFKMAKPFEPIPMPYAKLNDAKSPTDSGKKNKKKDRKKKSENKNQEKLTNALLPKNLNEAQPLPTWQEKENNNISWKDHLKTLLYEKAVLVYATLSEYHFGQGNYGLSLRYIGLLARCQLVMNKLQYASNALRENCLLGRAGDCCIMMIQNWGKCENYNEQLHNYHDEDFKMMEQLEQDEQFYSISIGDSETRCVFLFDIRTIEQMLLKGAECYEAALKLSESDNILRRLANSLNEIGSYYLNRAKVEKKMTDIVHTCKKAETYLIRGLELFERVKDTANTALLYTNIGHLYRLLAHANTPADRGEITQQEKQHYNKAIVNYKKALQVMVDRASCPGIWDAVKWELSTALFNMGWIMHENPPSHLTKTDAEKEVIETLQKALQYCDFDEDNPKYPLYVYRAAIIHYRIGSLYHSHIWSTPNDSSNRKNIIQLTKIHYEKSAKLYFQSADAVNYFTSQMQRFALSEYLAETTSVLNTKIKHLQNCLEVVLELHEMVDLLVNKKVDIQEASQEEDEKTEGENKFKSCFSLLKLAGTRLQHILKLLVKCCLTKPPPNKDCEKLSELYKKCYKISFDLKDDLSFAELLSKIGNVLLCVKNECELFNSNS